MSTHRQNDAALIIYRVGPVLCCATSHPVMAVIQPPTVTRVPGSSARRPGIVTYSGRVVPITDLRVAFGVEETDWQSPGRLIIVDLGDHQVGFHVDRIGDVIPWPDEGWGPLPNMLPRDVFSRTWRRNEQIHLFADFDRLDALQADGVLRQYIEQLQQSAPQHSQPKPLEPLSAPPQTNRSRTSAQKPPAESPATSSFKSPVRQLTANETTSMDVPGLSAPTPNPVPENPSMQAPARTDNSRSKIPRVPAAKPPLAGRSTSPAPREPMKKAGSDSMSPDSPVKQPPAETVTRQTQRSQRTEIAKPRPQHQGGTGRQSTGRDTQKNVPPRSVTTALSPPRPSPESHPAPSAAPANSAPQPSSQITSIASPPMFPTRESPTSKYDRANDKSIWPLALLAVLLVTSGTLAWRWLAPENKPGALLTALPEVTARSPDTIEPDTENQSGKGVPETPESTRINRSAADQTHLAPAPDLVSTDAPAVDSVPSTNIAEEITLIEPAPTAVDPDELVANADNENAATAFQARILREDGGITIVLNTPRDADAIKTPIEPEQANTGTDVTQAADTTQEPDSDLAAEPRAVTPQSHKTRTLNPVPPKPWRQQGNKPTHQPLWSTLLPRRLFTNLFASSSRAIRSGILQSAMSATRFATLSWPSSAIFAILT